MTIRSFLSTYAYLASAIFLVGSFIAGLEFALFSAVEHVLWFRMMHHGATVPLWLWMIVLLTFSAIVFLFYRLLVAMLWQKRYDHVRAQKVEQRLQPFQMHLPPALEQIATWYFIEDDDFYAFTWGWRNPKIALSTGLYEALDTDAKTALLYHEAAHVRAHDPAQQLVFEVLCKAFPFLGIDLLYHRYQIRREIAADAASIVACGGNDVPLLKALLTALRPADLVHPHVGFEGALDARIFFLQTGDTPVLWDSMIQRRIFSMICFVSVLFGQGLLTWCH